MIQKFKSSALLAQTTAAACALAGLADWLLLDHRAGLSLALFSAAAGVCAIALNHHRIDGRRTWTAMVLVLLAVLPLLQAFSDLSMLVGAACLGLAAFALSGVRATGSQNLLRWLLRLAAMTPVAAPRDLVRWRRACNRARQPLLRFARVGIWIMPVGVALVFLMLFADANPVIEGWLAAIDWEALIALADPMRIGFWLIIMAGVWPLLRPRATRFLRSKARIVLPPPLPAPVSVADVPGSRALPTIAISEVIFGEAAILRALILFNALFAVQTGLDIAYLWNGAALPEGMSYAAYAHRGAYPLIVTALLAAGFVLAATRPGTPAAINKAIIWLIHLWIAQNIALVLSSILRLDLYVEVYALTYWRVAAFIWMGLVATGLALILARLITGRSLDWLLGANLVAAACVLYAACFVNFASLIANYNADHVIGQPEASSPEFDLDIYYLKGLGPQAIPAMDRLIAALSTQGRAQSKPEMVNLQQLAMWRDRLVRHHLETMAQWRSWTLRGWQLQRYLDGNPEFSKTVRNMKPDTTFSREPAP